MVHTLTLIALGLSALVLAYTGSRAGKGRAALLSALAPFFGTAVVVLLIGTLLTLPTSKPWSPGQTLGPGLLLGGLALLATVLIAAPPGELAPAIAAPTAGVAVILLLYPRQPLDALGGFMLGMITAGLLLDLGLRSAGDEHAGPERAAALEGSVLYGVTLAAMTFLATYHRTPTGVREWQSLPLLFGATLGIALLGGSTFRRGAAGSGAAAVIAPTVVMAVVIGTRLNGTPHFWHVSLIGMALFAVLGWIETGRTGGPDAARPYRSGSDLLTPLLVLGGAAIAFRWLHGYGIALLLLAGFGATGLFPPAARSGRRELLPAAFGFGVLVLLYRLYAERVGYTRGLEPDFLYYYAALILGAGLIPGLMQLLPDVERPPAGVLPRLLRTGLVGILAALAPLAVWLLFGERSQAALLVGLAIGVGLQLTSDAGPRAAAGRMLGIGAALSALQLTRLLGDFGTRTRAERVTSLLVVGLLLALWLGAVMLLERRRSRLRAGGAPAAASGERSL